MSIVYNGATLTDIVYNGTNVTGVVYNGVLVHGYVYPLYVEAKQANSTFAFTANGSPAWTGSYSTDNQNWSTYTLGTTVTLANVGDRVYFKGIQSANFKRYTDNLSSTGSGDLALGGNFMSLFFGDDFISARTFTYEYSGSSLFFDVAALTDINNLILPATTLNKGSYAQMFSNTGIKSIPAKLIPSCTAVSYSFDLMFCETPIISVPADIFEGVIVAEDTNETLGSVFQGCANLQIGPKIPHEELHESSWNTYNFMFHDATRFYASENPKCGNYAWTCPDGIAVQNEMFYGAANPNLRQSVANTTYYWFINEPFYIYVPEHYPVVGINKKGTADLPWSNGYYSFDAIHWEPYSIGDEITITDAHRKVYFKGVQTGAFSASSHMLINCGTPGITYIHVGGNIMSLWCGDDWENASEIPYAYAGAGLFYENAALVDITNLRLPALKLKQSCYNEMFYSCPYIEDVPAMLLPATTLSTYCYKGMFSHCNLLKNAPMLPATTLVASCYQNMFSYCRALNIDAAWSTRKYSWKCPDTTGISNPVYCMFESTGGTHSGDTPVADTYYYWSIL